MHKIYVDTSLFYHVLNMKYTQIYYKKLIKNYMYIHRPHMAPFSMERNVGKCKDEVLNPCIKVIRVIVYNSNNFVSIPVAIAGNLSV